MYGKIIAPPISQSLSFPRDIGKDRVCLHYHMNQCEGWCQENKSCTEYLRTAEQAKQLLSDPELGEMAKDELAELLGDRTLFATPKPVKMIKEFIRSSGKSDAIVMDFFAGSGTTGHATLELNHEDGGNRRFILITNNESDICRRVTIPRVKAAMRKYNISDNSLETKLL